mmetsp:Transcript_15627/g.43181  ORF Transcript_15627/g.43181 Transcript_15627/m.43181 type:complete len:339 (+) Transcript_15627:92-1108(+)
MKDREGLERGRCEPCARGNIECTEFIYAPYPDDDWEWEQPPDDIEEYRRRPLIPGIEVRLCDVGTPPLPGRYTAHGGWPPCANCGCPAETHDVISTTATEARCLDTARAIFAPLDLSTVIRQSVQDTCSLGFTREDFVYGEVGELSFLRLLDRMLELRRSGDRGVFYDLGCGAGKAVILAALHAKARFSRCIGIELLPGLAACAAHLGARYRAASATATAHAEATVEGEALAWAEVSFIEEDLFEANLSDASVVLVNAGGWQEPNLSRLQAKLLEALPDRCVLATIRKPLFEEQPEGFVELERLDLPMSWGVAPIFLSERRRGGVGAVCKGIDLEAMD